MEEFLIDIDIKKAIHTADGNQMLEIKLGISRHSFVTIFGRSGVGKTTLLRMIAGLTTPDSGYIRVNNKPWFDSVSGVNIKPQKRNIGFVFQDYALFPNMNVKEHLLFAQEIADKEYVSELLDIFHLKGLCKRKPAKLSGGQQQRLSVARALARKPGILLLDEPLSALDNETRLTLQEEIMIAHRNSSATTLLVSHDINEIFRLSDTVYTIEDGRVSIHGKPKEVFGNSLNCNNIRFEAKVVRIENNRVTLSADNSVFEIEMKPSDIENIKIGDKLFVTANTINMSFTKV